MRGINHTKQGKETGKGMYYLQRSCHSWETFAYIRHRANAGKREVNLHYPRTQVRFNNRTFVFPKIILTLSIDVNEQGMPGE